MALTQIIINISIVVRPTMYIKVFSKIINILKDKNISTHNSIPNIKLIKTEIKITSLVNIYSCVGVKNEYSIDKKMDCTKTNIMKKYITKTRNYTKRQKYCDKIVFVNKYVNILTKNLLERRLECDCK